MNDAPVGKLMPYGAPMIWFIDSPTVRAPVLPFVQVATTTPLEHVSGAVPIRAWSEQVVPPAMLSDAVHCGLTVTMAGLAVFVAWYAVLSVSVRAVGKP